MGSLSTLQIPGHELFDISCEAFLVTIKAHNPTGVKCGLDLNGI